MANRYLIEKCLVEHCSATLASMKSANLFNMTFVDDTDIEEQIEFWNQCMKEKGIRLYILRRQENRVLVYVYREKTARSQSEPAGSGEVPQKIRLWKHGCGICTGQVEIKNR